MNGLCMDELSAEVEVLESYASPRGLDRCSSSPLMSRLSRKLSKTVDLTSKISLSLKKLSASAQQVEQAVKPIYNKTQSLTVLSASACPNSLRGRYGMAQGLRPVLRCRYRRSYQCH